MAFQVFVKPDCYKVNGETVGANDIIIDPLFHNDELEWSTDEQGSTILYGLLVRLQPIEDVIDSFNSKSWEEQEEQETEEANKEGEKAVHRPLYGTPRTYSNDVTEPVE